MKFINWIINRYLLAFLMLSSLLCGIAATILLCAALFNFNPYYEARNKKGGWTFGTDYRKGIPVTISVNACSLFDTSFFLTSSSHNGFYSNRTDLQNTVNQIKDSSQKINTVYTNYNTSYENGNYITSINNGINGFHIPNFIVNIKPTSKFHRCLLILPNIFILLISSFSFWQICKFLQSIQLQKSFNSSNHKKLKNIGIVLIAYQLIIYIFDLFFNHYNVSVNFASTTPNWNSPMNLAGQPESHSSIWYIVIAGIFLIVAEAFKKGHNLQQEQDLTV
jgi:hypothetical protein